MDNLASGNAIPSTREYDGIILFNHGAGLKYPFKFFKRETFDATEIREPYYMFQLLPQSRMRLLKTLKKFKKESLAIFAKVEKGMSYREKKKNINQN